MSQNTTEYMRTYMKKYWKEHPELYEKHKEKICIRQKIAYKKKKEMRNKNESI